MHGTAYLDSGSCKSLRKSGSQHMRSALNFLHSGTARKNLDAAGDHHSSVVSSTLTNTTTTDSFVKDDRKVSVGDCALFKSSQDSPPFIGLIRCLNTREENNLHLGVNWLYRPGELKLGKGNLVDSAPNEIFYSFHEDKIPAASLLHPCKVAFLPRGVDLSSGTLAFVCRRVYDVANKCLWWLTDQDYINERQEEVDHLLLKTRIEMHATLQPGDHSPKQVNSPSSTAKLKPGCDDGQNSSTSFPCQVKAKKRERGNHGTDPVKRDHSSRSDDDDAVQCKAGNNLKFEIAKITEKGGVNDLDGVEKLINLMQSNRTEKNRNLLSRSMLAGVMAATDKVDCLNGFVQLRGLPVLDEWLQDIHKGKIGDGVTLKDVDKSVEEFLVILLRALDKLPVDLNALQMCNIGRSVNHLRTHKNLEIQRKARSLVDTWKKRVEAEMINIDSKSGSTPDICVWPSKSRLSEVSHCGSKTPSGTDVALKCSIAQNSAIKTASARSLHGESNMKSATSSPEPLKSASSPVSGKEIHPKLSFGGTSDVPLIREDRSSSSNQPNHSSQSFSGKEDGKSSAGLAVSKVSNSASRNRKSSGFCGGSVSGSQKETSSSRLSSSHKTVVAEKSQSASSERVIEVPITEGSSHKLIVKIPNCLESPPHGVGRKSLEDPTFVGSLTSSEVLSTKQEHFDQTSKDKNDAYVCNDDSDMNVESWQSSDFKDLLIESGEGAGSPAALLDEDQSMNTKDSPTNQLTASKLQEPSFCPMNALLESCAKYSVGNSSLTLEDEGGMNLLASVVSREMSKFVMVSPSESTDISTYTGAENCVSDEAKSKPSYENCVSAVGSQFSVGDEFGEKKHTALGSSSLPADRLLLLKKVSVKFDGDMQCASSLSSEDLPAGGVHKPTVSSITELKKSSDAECNKKKGTSSEKMADYLMIEKINDEKVTSTNPVSNRSVDCKSEEICVETDEKAFTMLGEGKLTAEIAESNKVCEGDDNKDLLEKLNTGAKELNKMTLIVKSEIVEKNNGAKLRESGCGQNSDSAIEAHLSKADELNAKSCLNEVKYEEDSRDAGVESHRTTGFCSTSNDVKGHKETHEQNIKIVERMSFEESNVPVSVKHETQQKVEFEESTSTTILKNEAEKCAMTAVETCSSTTRELDPDAIKFDLNEGFSTDEGKPGDPVNVINSSLSAIVHSSNSVPFFLDSVSGSHSPSITVAAAAKGPFVHPEDLTKTKGELGWKGSAATSAFRPAEPKKSFEKPIGSANTHCFGVSANKNARVLLDIDLNVPDFRVLEEMAFQDSAFAVNPTNDFVCKSSTVSETPGFTLASGSGGLNLDLNRVDESNDNSHITISRSYHKREFDLNDGPVDNTLSDQFPVGKKAKGCIPFQLPSSGLIINSPGMGGFPSWFPPGNTYSPVPISSVISDQVDQPFPVFPPNASQRAFGPINIPFTQDLYRPPVLSSSPAVSFPSSHFQYPAFPFGTTVPLPSATFPVGTNLFADSSSGARLFAHPVNSQFLGPVGSVASQFPRSFVINYPDGGCNGALENDRKWGRAGLDLNAGPGTVENEVKEESSAQHSVASSHPVEEEQARLQSASGGVVKRKEPDGGWDNRGIGYKQFSWQ